MEGILHTTNYKTFQILSDFGDVLAEFEGTSKLPNCLPGDRVRKDLMTDSWICYERATYPLLAGRIELGSKTTYGLTSRGIPLYLFLPYRKEFPPMIVGCSSKERVPQVGLAVFESWNRGTTLPRASLLQLFGPSGDIHAERTALLWTYSPVRPYKQTPPLSEPRILKTPRVDAPLQTFSIDPEGCRDVDDALSILELDNDSVQLWISIADVASVIEDGSELDQYAKSIGQTFYSPGGRVMKPMLPYKYSEDVCSLIQEHYRPAISLILTFESVSQTPKLVGTEWVRSTLMNRNQYSYDTFVSRANAHGLPVSKLESIVKCLGAKSKDVHEWIEVCMLTYNHEAAKLLERHSGGILRRQAGTKQLDWIRFDKECPGLAKLAESSAEYCRPTDLNLTHSHLGLSVYCHASSPIRRYADLFNQRALHAIFDTQADLQMSWKELYTLNRSAKDAKSYSRDMAFMEQLADQPQGHIDGFIIDATQKDVDGRFHTWSHKVWIPAWNRMITWKSELRSEPETWVLLEYSSNMKNRFWKDRILFRPLEM